MTATDPPPTTAAELTEKATTCARLMGEYAEKLTRWADEAGPLFAPTTRPRFLPEEVAARAEAIATHRDRFMRIHPACQDLSGIGSGFVEARNIEYLLRTEVRLRLAEFENAMERYRLIVQGEKKPTATKSGRRVAVAS